MTLPPETLARQALEQIKDLPGQRKLIAVAGPPGAGKSTITAVLADVLQAEGHSAAVVPMDGFHLDNAVLKSRNLLHVKGAPETFDAAGFCHLVRRIAMEEPDIVYPVFDRQRDIAIAGAAVLAPEVEYVLFEGNYLVLEADPWRSLAQYWTRSIWIDVSADQLEMRLMARWLAEGLSEAESRAKVQGNDLPNSQFVQTHSRRCDITLSS